MARTHKGFFRPKHPEKYKGDPTKIVYRSRWELDLMLYFDSNDNVVDWQSEETIVPYRSPIDNKIHRYFPDFLVTVTNSEGKKDKILIEVKPKKQTKAPDPSKRNATPTGRISTRYLKEVKTYGINNAKWEAAKEYCLDRGWKFAIFTEDEIYGRKKQ